jgi:Transglycosylase SLT domain
LQTADNHVSSTRSPTLADGPVSSPNDASPDEVLVFDKMRVPRWLAETVVRAAQATNVDPAYMMALADKESSFIPDIKARTSSAEGLFQFIESTWLEVMRRFGPKHGYAAEAEAIQLVRGKPVVADTGQREAILALRRDPYLSALMAGEMINTHRETLAGKVARDPSFGELYMAHFLGLRGASRFVALLGETPGISAPGSFPMAARANRTLFFASGREAAEPRFRALTVADVFRRIDGMINRRVVRYAGVRQDVVPGQETTEKTTPSPVMNAQAEPGGFKSRNLGGLPLPPAIAELTGLQQTAPEVHTTSLPVVTREGEGQRGPPALATAAPHTGSGHRAYAAIRSPLAEGAVAPNVSASVPAVARVTSTAVAQKTAPLLSRTMDPLRSRGRVKVASLGPERNLRANVLKHPVQKDNAYDRELKLAKAQVHGRHSPRTASDSKRFWAAHEQRIRVLTKQRASS